LARLFFLSPGSTGKLLLGLALAAAAAFAQAKPAPWYWWVSKVDGARICLQTAPGSGWYRDGGPYRNGRCGADLPR
jgi:hypothetical protein